MLWRSCFQVFVTLLGSYTSVLLISFLYMSMRLFFILSKCEILCKVVEIGFLIVKMQVICNFAGPWQFVTAKLFVLDSSDFISLCLIFKLYDLLFVLHFAIPGQFCTYSCKNSTFFAEALKSSCVLG